VSRVVIYIPELDADWRIQLEDDDAKVIEVIDMPRNSKLPEAFRVVGERWPDEELFVPQGFYSPGLTSDQDVVNIVEGAQHRPSDRGEL
jgi:hypothetical protein